MNDIDRMLEIARETQPNLWERTERVAKIVDPSAFLEDWVAHPPERGELLRLRLKVLQGNAISKAHEILRYLGVNTETDWYTILTRLAGEPAPEAKENQHQEPEKEKG